MRWIWAPIALFSLSGCAVPTAVTVASLAAGFSSYTFTGKGTVDHGLSLVTQQDCVLLQLTDGALCRERETYEEQQFAALTPLPGASLPGAAQTAETASGSAPRSTLSAPAAAAPATGQGWQNPETRLLPTSNPSIFVAANYAQSLTPPQAPQSASVFVITGEGLSTMPQEALLPAASDNEG